MALRGILAKWDTFDDEQREHYAGEVGWILGAVREQLDQLGGATLDPALAACVDASVKDFRSFGDEIERALGFRPDDVLSAGGFAAVSEHTRPTHMVTTQASVTVLRSKTIQLVSGVGCNARVLSRETITTRTTTKTVDVTASNLNTRQDTSDTASNTLAEAA